MVDLEYSFNEILQKLRDVWGDYDDFKEGGFDYVSFIIGQDLQNTGDEYGEQESVEELADTCINSMRMMYEMGYDPTKEIYERLENHEEKNPPDIIEKYQKKYGKR